MTRLLRAADRAAIPWKNGGGVTREIAAFPPGAGMDDFVWRVSVADVVASGPFSRFEQVDRVLTVIEGRLSLHFTDDGRSVVLDPGQSCAFPGDVAVTGAPIGGPVRDLNVMVRRGRWRATVERWGPGLAVGGVRIAFATSPSATLDLYDTLVLDPGDAMPVDFEGLLIRIESLVEGAA